MDGAPHRGEPLTDRLRLRLAMPGLAEPLYARLSREIGHQITSGQLVRGESLPGERVLAERLCLSRVTVRKAIDGLVEAGRLIRRPGAGTEVAGRVEKSLTRLTSFSEDIAARGLVPGCIWLCKERVRNDIHHQIGSQAVRTCGSSRCPIDCASCGRRQRGKVSGVGCGRLN